MVWSMVAGVTAGSVAPGVQVGSGRTYRPVPRPWQVPEGVRPAAGGAEVTGAGAAVVGEAVAAGIGAGVIGVRVAGTAAAGAVVGLAVGILDPVLPQAVAVKHDQGDRSQPPSQVPSVDHWSPRGRRTTDSDLPMMPRSSTTA